MVVVARGRMSAQLVWTMTQLPGVAAVRVTVEGRDAPAVQAVARAIRSAVEPGALVRADGLAD
jgi:spore germination protein GerM